MSRKSAFHSVTISGMGSTVAADELLTVINKWGTIPVREAWNVSGLPPDSSPLRDSLAARFDAAVRRDDAYLTATADALYDVLAAGPEERARRANALIARIGMQPQVREDGSLAWAATGDRHGVMTAGLALVIEEQAFGVCQAHRCADLYLDGSNARSRQYCTLSCQERARQRNFRLRRKAQADGAS